jgi:hypothetical protein
MYKGVRRYITEASQISAYNDTFHFIGVTASTTKGLATSSLNLEVLYLIVMGPSAKE